MGQWAGILTLRCDTSDINIYFYSSIDVLNTLFTVDLKDIAKTNLHQQTKKVINLKWSQVLVSDELSEDRHIS